MVRRQFIASLATAGALFAGAGALFRMSRPQQAAAASFPVTKTEEEWRAQLSEEQYAVLREEATLMTARRLPASAIASTASP